MSSPTNSAPRRVPGRFLSSASPWLSGAAGAVVIAAVAVFLYQAGAFSSLIPKAPVPLPEIENPEQVTSSQSLITGFDGGKLPYTVRAAKAEQDAEKSNIVRMQTVSGDFEREGGQQLKVTARNAVYDTITRLLDLEGNVVIKEEGRFSAVMDKALVTVEEKKLTSETPVVVTFANGSIAANGVAVTNNGKNILFMKGVKAHFGGQETKGDGKP
jgi:lipopolysaccharide export system protein LptC